MSAQWRRRPVYVAGVAMSTWGYYPDLEPSAYASKAIHEALADAGLGWKEVQAVFCGTTYGGTGSGHRVIKEVGFTGIPIVNVENACSSSASAFRLAYQQVAAEIYDVVLAFGIEKNPKGPIASTAFRRWELELGFNFHPGNYALETVQYMARTGATEEDISLVTVKNRKNAVMNPNARFQKAVTLDEVMNARLVAPPLRLLHCCPLADGAAVTIICSKNKLKSVNRAVRVAASELVSASYGEEYVPGGVLTSLQYPPETTLTHLSSRQAYEVSGYGPEDVDIVQAYDTVASSELWDIEELGFCKDGEAPKLLREGALDIGGKLPVNTDGGLLGRGHPMGATGAGQIVEIVQQLRGEAGARQVPKARIGLAHAMGAGPNSAVTILAL